MNFKQEIDAIKEALQQMDDRASNSDQSSLSENIEESEIFTADEVLNLLEDFGIDLTEISNKLIGNFTRKVNNQYGKELDKLDHNDENDHPAINKLNQEYWKRIKPALRRRDAFQRGKAGMGLIRDADSKTMQIYNQRGIDSRKKKK